MKPLTSPILFPPGQQKEVELRLNYISKVEIILSTFYYNTEEAKVVGCNLINNPWGDRHVLSLSTTFIFIPKLAVFDSERKVLKFLYKSSMRIIRKSIKCKEKQVKSCHLPVADRHNY